MLFVEFHMSAGWSLIGVKHMQGFKLSRSWPVRHNLFKFLSCFSTNCFLAMQR